MIVDLKSVLDGVSVEELEEALEKKRSQQRPTIFDRFPKGSHICGLEILNHCHAARQCTIAVHDPDGYKLWLPNFLTERLIDCHDWIDRYAPVLEEFRKSFKHAIGNPLTPVAQEAEKAGIWKSKTPVKKPWGDV